MFEEGNESKREKLTGTYYGCCQLSNVVDGFKVDFLESIERKKEGAEESTNLPAKVMMTCVYCFLV